jgi:hypothetical protein
LCATLLPFTAIDSLEVSVAHHSCHKGFMPAALRRP